MANILAEPEDLFERLGIEDASETMRSRAESILDDVADQVLRFTRQDFTAAEDDTVTLNGTGTRVMLLPQLPVTEVTLVTEGGTALAVTDWEWSSDGRLVRLGGGYWLNRLRHYVVTYSHGYAEIPAGVRGIVVRVAARGWSNPTGLTQEGASGWTGAYGFDTSRFPMLAPADKDELRDWMAR